MCGETWVKAAYLHGSVARAAGPARDIDIGLLGDAPEWGAELGIAGELQAASGITAVDFDVRLVAGADPVFLGALLREGKLIYEADHEARIRFETQALSVWLDYQPVWERVRHAVTRRWADD